MTTIRKKYSKELMKGVQFIVVLFHQVIFIS